MGSAQGADCWLSDSSCPCFYSSTMVLLPQLSWTIWAHGLQLANLWQQTALQCACRLIAPESAKSILQLLPSAQKKIEHFLWWEKIYHCSAAWRCMGCVLLCCWAVGSVGICCAVTRPEIQTLHSINERAKEPGSFHFPSFLPEGICSYLRNQEVQTQKLKCYFVLPLDLIV